MYSDDAYIMRSVCLYDERKSIKKKKKLKKNFKQSIGSIFSDFYKM